MNLTAGSAAAEFMAFIASQMPIDEILSPPADMVSIGSASLVCSASMMPDMFIVRTASRGITG